MTTGQISNAVDDSIETHQCVNSGWDVGVQQLSCEKSDIIVEWITMMFCCLGDELKDKISVVHADFGTNRLPFNGTIFNLYFQIFINELGSPFGPLRLLMLAESY